MAKDRYVVMREFGFNSNENGVIVQDVGFEPIKSFEDREEAENWIKDQKDPDQLVIQDNEDTSMDFDDEDYFSIFRDNDDSDYDLSDDEEE